VLAAYPGYPRRRALEDIGADAMFVAPDVGVRRCLQCIRTDVRLSLRHTSATLRATGLGAVHGSEIVHILHTYGSHLGRRLHPLGRWLTPAVGRRMQRTWLEFAGAAGSDRQPWSRDSAPLRHDATGHPRHSVVLRYRGRRSRCDPPLGVERTARVRLVGLCWSASWVGGIL